MGGVALDLLPLIVGAAALPIWIIIVLFLLRGEGGVVKAAAFVGGVTAVRFVQGVLFGFLFGAAEQADSGGETGTIVATLLLVVGILLLVTAAKQWRKEDDPDAPPPKWMATLSGLSAAGAFGAGAMLVAIAAKQWVFTLSAIGIISEAQLSRTGGVVAFAIYVVGAQLLILAPIVFAWLAPARSAPVLAKARGWLERHNRTIVIVVSLVFGMLFSYNGVTGLTG